MAAVPACGFQDGLENRQAKQGGTLTNKTAPPKSQAKPKPGQALQAVLELARRDPGSAEALSVKLGQVTSELEKAEAVLADLLGVEAKAKPVLTAKLEELKREQNRLSGLQTAGFKYRHLDLEPLKWRDEQGFPKFALFESDNPRFEIRSFDLVEFSVVDRATREVYGVFLTPKLPLTLANCYLDVVRRLENLKKFWGSKWSYLLLAGVALVAIGGFILSRGLSAGAIFVILGAVLACFSFSMANGVFAASIEYTISTEYQGLIPTPVKERIKQARPDFENIYILAEVPEWKLNKVIRPDPDPLILGWKGGNLWLIDSFDTTPVEEYLKREFTA